MSEVMSTTGAPVPAPHAYAEAISYTEASACCNSHSLTHRMQLLHALLSKMTIAQLLWIVPYITKGASKLAVLADTGSLKAQTGAGLTHITGALYSFNT